MRALAHCIGFSFPYRSLIFLFPLALLLSYFFSKLESTSAVASLIRANSNRRPLTMGVNERSESIRSIWYYAPISRNRVVVEIFGRLYGVKLFFLVRDMLQLWFFSHGGLYIWNIYWLVTISGLNSWIICDLNGIVLEMPTITSLWRLVSRL